MTDFPHKLNEWIEEEVDVPSTETVVNEKENRVEFKQNTRKATQKTIYLDSKPTRVICGDHHYTCIDKAKYVFKCTKCDWHKIAFPVTYKFNPETGKLIHRETGIQA